MFSAMICMGCSTLYHLFNAHSEKVHRLTARFDYAGTSILICGSYYPATYYIYFCNEGKDYSGLIWLFLTGISISASLVFIVSLTESFQQPEYRTLRGLVFLSLGLLGAIPLLHMLIFMYLSLRPLEIHYFSSSLTYFVLMGTSYIAGVGIYVSRIPERFYPGRFDLVGNSHNIWHCFVLMAALWHYVGSIDAFHLRIALECPVA